MKNNYYSLDFQEIQNAANHLKPYVAKTPLLLLKTIAQKNQTINIYAKLENIQNTGAFKIRGAEWKIYNEVKKAQKTNQPISFVTASHGNHGLGVATSAKRYNKPATVILPESTPKIKRKAIHENGAKIILTKGNFEDAEKEAIQFAKNTPNTRYIPPFEDPDIMHGQGTIALSIQEQWPNIPLDTIVAPIGGGGLISGLGCAFQKIFPSTTIIGVESTKPPNTIAEGIDVKFRSKKMIATSYYYTDFIQIIEDQTIKEGMQFLKTHPLLQTSRNEKPLNKVEGAGAASIAYALSNKFITHSKKDEVNILCIITGSNIDTEL